jgi:hypothetical protein
MSRLLKRSAIPYKVLSITLAAVDADVDSATYVVLAASPNWTSSVHIRGCSIDRLSHLIYLCYPHEQNIIGP